MNSTTLYFILLALIGTSSWPFLSEKSSAEQKSQPPHTLWQHPDTATQDIKNIHKGNVPPAMMVTNDNWTSLGPNGPVNGSVGPVDVIAFDPADASTLWLGSTYGGLWKSTDNGANWSATADQWPCLSVSDIAINPNNGNHVFVTTGARVAQFPLPFGIRKSDDGGASWTTLADLQNATGFYRLLIVGNNDINLTTLIVATNDGVWRSTDGGGNFTKSTGINWPVLDMEFKPGDTDVIYAVNFDGTDPGFFKSTDNGATFSALSFPISPYIIGQTSLAVSAADDDKVFLLLNDESLHRYSEANNTFSILNNSLNLIGPNAFDWSLGVDPANTDNIYVGSEPLLQSTDGGTTFTNVPIHPGINAIEYHPSTGKAYFGSDGGIERENAAGTGLEQIMNGLSIMKMQKLGGVPGDPTKILIGSEHNGINFYNGGTWSFKTSGNIGEVAIDPIAPQIMHAASGAKQVIKSSDGGVTWRTVLDGSMTGNQMNFSGSWGPVIHPDNRKVLFVGLVDVWKSIDEGETYTNLTNGNLTGGNINDIEIAPRKPDYIYVVQTGVIHKSTDGGATWTTTTAPDMSNAVIDLATDPADEKKVFAIIGNGKVYASDDEGGTWADISAGLPADVFPNSIVYRDGSTDELYLGNKKGVYFKNGTSDWVAFDNNLPNVEVRELEINGCNNKIRAATYGRGLWESPLENTAGICCPPIATINTPTTTCAPLTLTATAAPAGYTYQWYDGENKIMGETSQTLNVTGSGEYAVQYKNPSSCNSHTSLCIKITDCASVPFTDDVEAGISNGWTIYDPNNNGTWRVGTVSGCANNGTMAIMYPADDAACLVNTTIGPNDNFVGCFDLTGATEAKMNFDLSLPTTTPITDPTYRLKVDVSTDCGMNYTNAYDKSNADLITSTSTASPFTPATCADWRNEEVCLDDFAGNEILIRVTVEWLHSGDCNPNLYLDNLTVNKGTPACNICPVAVTVADGSTSVCSGTSVSTGTWQGVILAANPTVASNPDAQINYSSVTPVGGTTDPNTMFPSGNHSGVDKCVAETQAIMAYLYCDVDQSNTRNTGDTYTLLSTFTATVYPAIQAPTIATNGCAVTITGDCPNDIVTLSNQTVGTGVITNNGTNSVTYTAQAGDLSGTVDVDIVSGIGGSTCTYTTTTANTPACCPTAVTVADASTAVCSGTSVSTGTWQNDIITTNPTVNPPFSQINYSSVTPVAGVTDPNEAFPSGTHSGADNCVAETQSISAYLYCDVDQSNTRNTGDTYILLSTFTATVYPAAQAPAIVTNGCVVTITGDCPNDVVTLSNQTVGTGVITNNSTNSVTYTAPAGDPAGMVDVDVVSGISGNPCTYTTSQAPTPTCCPSTNIMYVDADTPNDSNGSDWSTAIADLQEALELAKICSGVTEIWVAKGTYYTTSGTDRTVSFALMNGISIYGGFAGNETMLSQRDINLNESILSGDIGTAGDASDNSYHVFYHYGGGINHTAVLDGFIISGGNADGIRQRRERWWNVYPQCLTYR